jgi:quercetin dioxygenase-like cupin family protein
MSGYVSRRGEGESVRNPIGGAVEFKALGAETGGSVTAIESVAAPGEGPPLHVHADADEVLYFLEGEFRVELDGKIEPAPAGSFVFIPRGLSHTWQNVGDGPARLIALFTPASEGMERFFVDFAATPEEAPLAEAFGAASAGTPMDVLGPPLAQRAET